MEFLQKLPNDQVPNEILAMAAPEQNLDPRAAQTNQVFTEEKRTDRGKELDTSSYTNDYPPDYEKALIEKVKEGDPSAFGPIYDHWYPVAKKFAYFKTGSESLAEDFASEAMWKAIKKIDQLPDTKRGFGPWILVITKNLIRDHYKSSEYNRTIFVEDTGINESYEKGVDVTEQTISELTRIKILEQVKNTMVETGRKDQFDAIVDAYFIGYTLKEAARIRGITEGALKSLLFRGTRSALRILKQKGYSKETLL